VVEPDEIDPGPASDRPPLSRSFIVALRIVLLLASAGAVVAAVAIGVRGRGAAVESSARFVCPMHPEVRSPTPGGCPICGMALEPIGRDATAANRRGDMPGMPDITAVENIRKHRIIDFVRRRSLPASIREIRGAAWVDEDRGLTAIYYNDQIQALGADEAATFSPARAPRTTVAVRRTADPAVPWDRSTSLIRFRPDPAAPAAATKEAIKDTLAPGQVGWIELERRSREVLIVAASAILPSPEGPYVLALVGPGRFEKRPIEIGETFLKQGFAVVLSGLRDRDRVVSRAAFFIDADRRLGGGAVAAAAKADPTPTPNPNLEMPGAP
jgi:hypothetical protein